MKLRGLEGLMGHLDKQRFRIGMLGFFIIAVILGFLGVNMLSGNSQELLPNRADLQIGTQTVDSSIRFETETLKENESGGNYFVNYRLKREQVRQETKSMLSKLLDSRVEKSQVKAQEKWLELSCEIQKEGEIENLLKIKGFQDAVADVFSEYVTVIVYAPKLSPYEISFVQDIVAQVTNTSPDKITVSSKQ